MQGGQTIRSKQNCIKKTITLDPWVNLNNITTDGKNFYYKNEKLHPKKQKLGYGSYGSVIAYQYNEKDLIAVKTFLDQRDAQTEVNLINQIKDSCSLIQAKGFYINNTESAAYLKEAELDTQLVVVMPAFDGTIDDFQYALQVDEIVKMGIQLGNELQCLINNFKLYYTDLKSAQVLYKCATNNTFHIRLADIGSLVDKNAAYAAQTFPFPIPGYNKHNFGETHKSADESVVVYGLVLYLLNFMGRNIYRISLDYLTHSRLLVGVHDGVQFSAGKQNTYKTFLHKLNKIVQTSPLEIPSILKKMIGLQQQVIQKCDNPYCNNKIDKICKFTNDIGMVCQSCFDSFSMENLSVYNNIEIVAPSMDNTIYNTIEQNEYTLQILLEGLHLYLKEYRIETE